MSTRRFIIAIFLIALAAATYFFYFNNRTMHRSGQTRVTVAQVGEFFIYMPLYIAIEKGYFKAEGIDVEVINTGGDEKSVAAIISGSADFGVGDPTFAAIAGLRGQDVKVIASVVNGVPFWGVTKNLKVPTIREPADLKGFSVATFPSPSTAFTLQTQMFKAGGVEPSIRQAQFGTLLPLLSTNTVDIVLELEPNVATAVSQGARVVYSMAERYGEFAITGVTVSQKMLSERRELVVRFVRALDKAEQFAHQDREAAIRIAIAKFPSISATIAADAMKRMLDGKTFPAGAMITQTAWRNALKLRVEAGDLPSIEAAEKFLDNSIAASVR